MLILVVVCCDEPHITSTMDHSTPGAGDFFVGTNCLIILRDAGRRCAMWCQPDAKQMMSKVWLF